MPPKKNPQGKKATETEAQSGEHNTATTDDDSRSLHKVEEVEREPRKTAKETHLESPNTKLSTKLAKVDEKQTRTRQSLLALQRKTPSIYDALGASSQSPPDPFEPEEKDQLNTSWADEVDQHEATEDVSPEGGEGAMQHPTIPDIVLLYPQHNDEQQVPNQSNAPPSIALAGHDSPTVPTTSETGVEAPQSDFGEKASKEAEVGHPQAHLATPTRETLRTPQRATHETPEGGLSKLDLPDILQLDAQSKVLGLERGKESQVVDDSSTHQEPTKNNPLLLGSEGTEAVGSQHNPPSFVDVVAGLSNEAFKQLLDDSIADLAKSRAKQETQKEEVSKNLDDEFTRVATKIRPHECPLLQDNSKAKTCTVLAKWLKSPKLSNAPAMTTFTYHYTTGRNANGMEIGANLYAKLLPDGALKRLWDIHPWSVHIGGDDLLKAKPAGVQGQVSFSPYVAKPHVNYPTLLKGEAFYFQPQPFQAASHSHGNDVHTMLQHCTFLGKGLADTITRSGGSVGGWIVLPSYDHHVDATNYLACQSVSFIRDIKRYIKQVVMFNQVSFQIPLVNADGTLAIQHSRKQLQNYVALYLHAGKGNPPMGEPITIDLGMKRDLSWGLGRLGLEATPETRNTHLRFAIHPSIIEVENVTSARDFYEYINNSFSPDEFTNTISSKNCYYPFVNGWVTVPRTRGNMSPPNAG